MIEDRMTPAEQHRRLNARFDTLRVALDRLERTAQAFTAALAEATAAIAEIRRLADAVDVDRSAAATAADERIARVLEAVRGVVERRVEEHAE